MTGKSILSPILTYGRRFLGKIRQDRSAEQTNLHTIWQQGKVGEGIHLSPTAERVLQLLGPLRWDQMPERDLVRNYGQPTVPYTAFAAAYLVKLNEGFGSMGELCNYLEEHPDLKWLLGFGRYPREVRLCGSVPTSRHLTQMLRMMPNEVLQFLLDDTIRLIGEALREVGVELGETVSVDTKHVIAWVKENNPKQYVSDRYNKANQPKGDPDCKLGCKRRINRGMSDWITPRKKSVPARDLKVGDFYWGYGSGIVVMKIPQWGEVVLAELTQPFDKADLTYFYPLMKETERRLGRRPRFATFDAAFDAFYVYEYFHRSDGSPGFAAVPFGEKGGYCASRRTFSPEGLPICAAGLPMPLKATYTDRTLALIEHERGKYVCPLFFPQVTGKPCPVDNPRAAKRGCTVMMPTSIGARLRYQLDRNGDDYHTAYKQRTAVERVNSQAVALGIERPHLRNGKAIANQNTLIYILINLRTYHRICQKIQNLKES